MSSIRIRLLILTLLFPGGAFIPGSPAIADEKGPNLIVVMADDMGFSDPGCYGGEIRTPTIDRLAAEGLRFSQFYNCNKCGPSRASLLTGCYPWKVGQAPGESIFRNLTRNCVTIPQLLKRGGYTTAAVGRLDMVTADDWHNPVQVARALDRFLGSASGGPGNYYREIRRTPWFRDGERWKRPDGPYSTELISDFAVDFIEESSESERPFFLYVAHYAPHWPLQAEEEDIVPYRELYGSEDRRALMEARLQRQIASGLNSEGTTLHGSMLNAKPATGGDRERGGRLPVAGRAGRPGDVSAGQPDRQVGGTERDR